MQPVAHSKNLPLEHGVPRHASHLIPTDVSEKIVSFLHDQWIFCKVFNMRLSKSCCELFLFPINSG